jgi:hypothetical protein
VANWLRFQYERNDYIVDLDRIAAFSSAPNGRLTFWLPDSAIPIVLNRQTDPITYERVQTYITQRMALPYWLKITYDRSEYLVDLQQLSAFSHSPNGKLTFWLPGSSLPIILSTQTDPASYTKIVQFIAKQTGLDWPPPES